MTDINQEKVKDLLRAIVGDIFDCLPANQYTQTEYKSIMSRINSANLLTDKPKRDIIELLSRDPGYQ